MTEILILGGSGFIGKNLIIKCLEKKWNITSISNKRKLDINHKLLKKYNIDLSNYKKIEKILNNKNFDYVINASGYVNHDNKISSSKQIINEHFINIVNVINFINQKKLKKFVQIGSGDEYGNYKKKLKENLREQPISNYALAKAAITKYLEFLHRHNNFPCIILRTFLLYGPYQNKNRLIPFVISNCLNGRAFPVSKGEQLRDFCYIDDFIELIFKILKNNKKIQNPIFNVGSGKSHQIKDVINKIITIIKFGNPKYGKIANTNTTNIDIIPDLNKIQNTFKWKSKINLNDGLKKTINFIKNNGRY